MPIIGFMRGVPDFIPAGQTQAWVNAVVANGGTVSFGREVTVNALIVGLISDRVWQKLDRLWIFAAENTPSALTDMIATSSATTVNSPTFTTDRGYTGNGVNAYIDSNFDPTAAGSFNFVQDSASFFGWTNTGSDSNPCFGNNPAGTGSNTLIYIYPDQSGTAFYAINDSAGGSFNFHQTGATGLGLTHVNRSGATASQAYFNGSSVQTSANASAALVSKTLAALGGNGNFYSGQACAFGFGASLSSTDATNLYNRLRTYMTAVGVP